MFHISIWVSLELCLGRLSPLKPPVATELIEPPKNEEHLLVSIIFNFDIFEFKLLWVSMTSTGTVKIFQVPIFPFFKWYRLLRPWRMSDVICRHIVAKIRSFEPLQWLSRFSKMPEFHPVMTESIWATYVARAVVDLKPKKPFELNAAKVAEPACHSDWLLQLFLQTRSSRSCL